MAIITAGLWSSWSNTPLAEGSRELLSVQLICTQVDVAIKKRLKRIVERQTISDLILDAPTTPNILLGRYAPIVISSFQCWVNQLAQGDPTAFTTNDLLTQYRDYALDKDPEDRTLSPGNLRRIGRAWGISYRQRMTQLAPQFDPNYGAVKVSFTGGWEVIPQDIVQAACLGVSMTLAVRKHGYIKGSESWNGYSYNIPGVGLMVNGIIGSPDLLSLLNPYINRAEEIG